MQNKNKNKKTTPNTTHTHNENLQLADIRNWLWYVSVGIISSTRYTTDWNIHRSQWSFGADLRHAKRKKSITRVMFGRTHEER